MPGKIDTFCRVTGYAWRRSYGLYLRRQQKHRRRPGGWRIAAAGGAAALAALIALPATGAVGQAAAAASTTASCPWVTSPAPVSQRLAQLMAAMSLDDKITIDRKRT